MRKKADLGKFLKELEPEELAAEIKKLYEKFPEVRTYYQIELTGNVIPYLEAAKKKITGSFYLKGGKSRKPKASRLNKIVKEFEQISIYPDDLVDLQLFRVEQTLEFLRAMWSRNEQLEQSTLRSFKTACELVKDQRLEEKFRQRIHDICHLPHDQDLIHLFSLTRETVFPF